MSADADADEPVQEWWLFPPRDDGRFTGERHRRMSGTPVRKAPMASRVWVTPPDILHRFGQARIAHRRSDMQVGSSVEILLRRGTRWSHQHLC